MSHSNELLSVDEALGIMLDSVIPLKKETIPITESTGRIIFDDIVAEFDIPPFHNSAMDGYAVRCSDIADATKEHPVILPVIGEMKAGADTSLELDDRSALSIMTGAPLPQGADSVAPVEYTKEHNGKVFIYKSFKKFENIRFAGEDISAGHKVIQKGDIIKSADVGLLASLNYSDVSVFKKPHVAIISTGDEIAEVGEPIKTGQIRNSNAYTLYSELKRYNAVPHNLGIARDTPENIKEKIIHACQYDIIITTGGVSMGKYDFVKDVLADIGIIIKTERIRMKPGKPLIFGTKGNILFFGLPGNPVSTMIAFILFVRPVILAMMGSNAINKLIVKAELLETINKKPERRHFIRGYFTVRDDAFQVTTTGPQGSGILRSMSAANCLIIVPEGVEKVNAGDYVSIMLIDHVEIP